jgi:hypothetical protein
MMFNAARGGSFGSFELVSFYRASRGVVFRYRVVFAFPLLELLGCT